MNQTSPLDATNTLDRESEWDRAAQYEKEERPITQVRKIEVRGALDVVYFSAPKAHMVVAAQSQEGIRDVITRYEGDKLIVEQEGVSINVSGGSVHISGSGNIVAGGSVFSVGSWIGRTRKVTGSTNVLVKGHGDCIVGIALPEAPSVSIKGSGDVTLYDVDQQAIELEIKGSGDIAAFGRVNQLSIEVAGSGDVDTSELSAASANLSVKGSGDIDAFVTESVMTSIRGSGTIIVRGNPPVCNQSISGSGKVKIKKN